MKRKRFRVRFHLGGGPYYMHWQVKDFHSAGAIEYYSPETCSLELTNCTLRNNPNTAMKIFNGQNKTVCAWVECDMIDVHYKRDPAFQEPPIDTMDNFKYNLRKHMYWFTETIVNADNKDVKKMFTDNRALYGRIN